MILEYKWVQKAKDRLLFPTLIWIIQLVIALITVLMVTKILPSFQSTTPGYFWSWDSGWYIGIARGGYEHNHTAPAFFPLFPLLIHLLHKITGISYEISATLISNFAFWLALIFLYQFILEEYQHEKGKTELAQRTLWLLISFPTALFFNCAYTESLTLLTYVLFFYFLQRDHWYLAMLCGFLSTAIHDLNLLLVIPGMVYLWNQRNQLSFNRLVIRFFSLAFIPASLALFIIYIMFIFIKSSQFSTFFLALTRNHTTNYGVPIYSLFRSLVHIYRHPFPDANHNIIGIINGILPMIMVIIGILMVTIYRKRMSLELISFYLVVLIVSITPYTGLLQSYGRYMSVLFPGFIIWAKLCQKEQWLLTSIWLMLPIKIVLLSLFANWYWIT